MSQQIDMGYRRLELNAEEISRMPAISPQGVLSRTGLGLNWQGLHDWRKPHDWGLMEDGILELFRFLDHGHTLLASSDSSYMRMFDLTGATVIGVPVFGNVGPPTDVAWMTKDRSTIVLAANSKLTSVDVSWLTSVKKNAAMVSDVCAHKLLAADEAASSQRDGPRVQDAMDTDAAPVLRGREGEDVCGWKPSWYDNILDLIFSH